MLIAPPSAGVPLCQPKGSQTGESRGRGASAAVRVMTSGRYTFAESFFLPSDAASLFLLFQALRLSNWPKEPGIRAEDWAARDVWDGAV